MTKLICLVGLPASGKSYYAKQLSEQYNAKIYSSDNFREELFGDINECNRNEELFKELYKRVKYSLSNKENVILDSTNLSYKKRKAILEEMKKYNCENICYLIATPYEKCLEQNIHRDRKVPEHIIRKMYMNINIPQMYEGFDEIHIIYNKGNMIFDINELLYSLDFINQDNPHHTLTIGEHCRKCADNIKSKMYYNKIVNENSENLYLAGLLHDIGKHFCKSFKNSKGEITENATYYQHHFVSAYDSLFYLKELGMSKDDILEITNLIQWHMRLFNETEKSKKKFINMVSEGFYNDLLLLHEADINAK